MRTPDRPRSRSAPRRTGTRRSASRPFLPPRTPWPGLSRPPTSFFAALYPDKDVGARAKPGQGGVSKRRVKLLTANAAAGRMGVGNTGGIMTDWILRGGTVIDGT